MDTDQVTNENERVDDTPEPVTREEFEGVQEELKRTTALNERLLAALENRETPQAAPVQAAEEPDDLGEPTDDDDEVTRTNKLIAKQLAPIKKGLRDLEQVGLGTMGKLSDRTAVAGLGESDKAIYLQYKKDVDGYLGRLNPIMRAQPESLEWALKLVKADHMEDIFAQRQEAAGRQVTKGAQPGTPTTRRVESGKGGGETIPTPEEIFGVDSPQARAIAERGGPDAYARRSSGGRFKNWGDWVKAHDKMSGKVEAK